MGIGWRPAQESNHRVDRDVFGDSLQTSRIDHISADFSLPLANNAVTSGSSGTGAVAQANGQATVSTGTTAGSDASLVTDSNVRYLPGHGVYAYFTARFTASGQAGDSLQRIGIYDADNGFFLGYNGTQFGVTRRTAAADTFTPAAQFTGDKLDGDAGSMFTRYGVPEAVDLSLLNVWRIRFGWLGSAVCFVEVMNPDGVWILAHTIHNPNSATIPVIEDPNLPIRMEVDNGSGTTDLVISTGSWSAGVAADPVGFSPEQLYSRTDVEITQVAVNNNSLSTYTVPTGRRLRVTDIILTASSDKAAGNRILLKDNGAAGTTKLPVEVPPTGGAGQSTVFLSHTFDVPLNFDTDVYLIVPDLGTGAASILLRGYLERQTA